ncbi:LysR family transcriptional regulator [Pseudosulfitobacter koreensis]|uniref:LysR family transcriptional regulator n=1 Tax=Pseudosulfitobacter koreensis TaxID=2968472 RepID=A0ABT1YYA0_9RHOB|nr:LysR family transcriptional regulator [Pseudosulfitobacter koreense]MCR8825849.1 LysR family transcriptional regulator [Pseudosulfitobacter koreense]
MQTLKPIRVFLEIVAQGSFVGAARSLHMTPASITRIVAQLEDDLGQQLLTRTTRQISLTGAGAVVAARYRPVLDEFDRITQEITRATQPNKGRLAINAPLSFGMRMLPGLIDSFRLAYPQIEVDVQLTDTLVDILEESCDLAIRISGPPTDKSTIWRRICMVPRAIVAGPALFDRITRPQTPAELDPAFCLSYGRGLQPETWVFGGTGATRTVRAGTKVVSNNGELLLALAMAGNGMVNLPRFLVQDAIDRGKVIEVLQDCEVTPLNLMLYYPPYDALPPLVATFTEFFEAYIRDFQSFDFRF